MGHGRGKYHVLGGSFDEEVSSIKLAYKAIQVIILVRLAKVTTTSFGQELLQSIQDRRRYILDLASGHRSLGDKTELRADPGDVICNPCHSFIHSLITDLLSTDLMLEDICKSATYRLEYAGDADGRIEVLGQKNVTREPSFSLSPAALCNLPPNLVDAKRVPASGIRFAEEVETSIQGKVILLDSVHRYFKPRTVATENDFDRELQQLGMIRHLPSSAEKKRLPRLTGIVVSEDKVVGRLLELVMPSSLGDNLLQPGLWTRPDLFQRWEEQVAATVRLLHAYDIVWGDVNPANIMIDDDFNAHVVDFGGLNNPEFIDDKIKETTAGDWQGIDRIFNHWLPKRHADSTMTSKAVGQNMG